jgi:hypothetical protein
MIPSPVEQSESSHIGSVEFISPNEIRISLEINAPDSVALNSGSPQAFPRINEYLLIPNSEGFIVGQVCMANN